LDIEKIRKSQALNNSNKFNFYLCIDFIHFEDLYNDFRKKSHLKRISGQKYKKHFSVLLANLIAASKNKRYLALSFSKNYYIIPEAYNPQKVRWDILSNIINFFKRKNIIDVHIGYKKGNYSRLTRIKLRENYEEVFRNIKVEVDLSSYSYLILKDENKEYKKFIHTPMVKRRKKL
jgi:hypothetical protein